MVFKVFYEKTGSGVSVKQQQADELHKPKKRKVNARFKDNFWAADWAEMGLLSILRIKMLNICYVSS